MSFFSQNATLSGGGDFEIADPGVYACRLKEVELVDGRDFNNPEIVKPQFKWVFETVEASDSQGRPYRFSKWTGRAYGNEKAGLTILLDQMAGKRLTPEQFAQLDLDNLKRISWNVMVDTYINGSGNESVKILSVRNAAKKGATIDAPVKPQPSHSRRMLEFVEEIDDPFNLPG